jgi:hypothetical protein
MTKQYSAPNNIKNSTMAMAVLDQINDAVSTWQIGTMSFSDSYLSSSGIILQVTTPSCNSWDKDRRNELLAFWHDLLTNNFPYKSGGELDVRWAFGKCICAEVIHGRYDDRPVVTVHLGYLEINELEAWPADTYDEALYEAVIHNATKLIPVKDDTES